MGFCPRPSRLPFQSHSVSFIHLRPRQTAHRTRAGRFLGSRLQLLEFFGFSAPRHPFSSLAHSLWYSAIRVWLPILRHILTWPISSRLCCLDCYPLHSLFTFYINSARHLFFGRSRLRYIRCPNYSYTCRPFSSVP